VLLHGRPLHPSHVVLTLAAFVNGASYSCEKIWDPTVAEEKLNGESIDFLASKNIPHNKRELAMITLAEMEYDGNMFDEDHIVESITTRDGTDWSDDDRRKYHLEIFRARKDIREVARVTGKSVNSCMAYYLGTFKYSDDYRLLKEVRTEERLRQMMESDRDLDACVVCDDGGNLLICDGCEGEYHMECLRPALQRVPDGKWECDECVDRAFIAAKDSLIRNTKLFKRVRRGSIRSDDQAKGEPAESSGTVLMRPASPVIRIITRLAQNISAVLSDGNVNTGR
jgi:PHD-finger